MSAPREDYYAILQVQPDAEPEVIEAAYRQLMRKYHPDVAGTDNARAASLHERAKIINRAYAVLGDSKQRWLYDRFRTIASASAGPNERDTREPADAGEDARTGGTPVRPSVATRRAYRGPVLPLIGAFTSLYYLLPGPYEWERGQGKEALATFIVPLLGVAGWSLSSGRLSWLTGSAPYMGLGAWVLLALLALPLWSLLPRLVLAGLPTVLLLTGPGEGLVRLAGVPVLVAWCAAGALGMVLSARLYLFAVLPTLVVCWTLANARLGQDFLVSAITGAGSAISTGQLGLLTLACLLGVLSWITLLDWRRSSGPARVPPTPDSAPSGQADTAPAESNAPLFLRISEARVRTLQIVPLRTDRDRHEQPSQMLAAKQEANVLLIRAPWAFIQTDDGREGWAEWRVA